MPETDKKSETEALAEVVAAGQRVLAQYQGDQTLDSFWQLMASMGQAQRPTYVGPPAFFVALTAH